MAIFGAEQSGSTKADSIWCYKVLPLMCLLFLFSLCQAAQAYAQRLQAVPALPVSRALNFWKVTQNITIDAFRTKY